jgi:hypothetical protein
MSCMMLCCHETCSSVSHRPSSNPYCYCLMRKCCLRWNLTKTTIQLLLCLLFALQRTWTQRTARDAHYRSGLWNRPRLWYGGRQMRCFHSPGRRRGQHPARFVFSCIFCLISQYICRFSSFLRFLRVISFSKHRSLYHIFLLSPPSLYTS